MNSCDEVVDVCYLYNGEEIDEDLLGRGELLQDGFFMYDVLDIRLVIFVFFSFELFVICDGVEDIFDIGDDCIVVLVYLNVFFLE